jgi:dihydroxyacetone kinase
MRSNSNSRVRSGRARLTTSGTQSATALIASRAASQDDLRRLDGGDGVFAHLLVLGVEVEAERPGGWLQAVAGLLAHRAASQPAWTR